MMEGERSISDFMVEEPIEDDCFSLCYTSGTTGDAKGVKLRHKAVINYVKTSVERDKDSAV